jgi:WD40 repeat protein
VQAVYQLAWAADSRLLVSGSADSTLKLWSMDTRKLHTDLPGHGDEGGLKSFPAKITSVFRIWIQLRSN